MLLFKKVDIFNKNILLKNYCTELAKYFSDSKVFVDSVISNDEMLRVDQNFYENYEKPSL